MLSSVLGFVKTAVVGVLTLGSGSGVHQSSSSCALQSVGIGLNPAILFDNVSVSPFARSVTTDLYDHQFGKVDGHAARWNLDMSLSGLDTDAAPASTAAVYGSNIPFYKEEKVPRNMPTLTLDVSCNKGAGKLRTANDASISSLDDKLGSGRPATARVANSTKAFNGLICPFVLQSGHAIIGEVDECKEKEDECKEEKDECKEEVKISPSPAADSGVYTQIDPQAANPSSPPVVAPTLPPAPTASPTPAASGSFGFNAAAKVVPHELVPVSSDMSRFQKGNTEMTYDEPTELTLQHLVTLMMGQTAAQIGSINPCAMTKYTGGLSLSDALQRSSALIQQNGPNSVLVSLVSAPGSNLSENPDDIKNGKIMAQMQLQSFVSDAGDSFIKVSPSGNDNFYVAIKLPQSTGNMISNASDVSPLDFAAETVGQFIKEVKSILIEGLDTAENMSNSTASSNKSICGLDSANKGGSFLKKNSLIEYTQSDTGSEPSTSLVLRQRIDLIAEKTVPRFYQGSSRILSSFLSPKTGIKFYVSARLFNNLNNQQRVDDNSMTWVPSASVHGKQLVLLTPDVANPVGNAIVADDGNGNASGASLTESTSSVYEEVGPGSSATATVAYNISALRGAKRNVSSVVPQPIQPEIEDHNSTNGNVDVKGRHDSANIGAAPAVSTTIGAGAAVAAQVAASAAPESTAAAIVGGTSSSRGNTNSNAGTEADADSNSQAPTSSPAADSGVYTQTGPQAANPVVAPTTPPVLAPPVVAPTTPPAPTVSSTPAVSGSGMPGAPSNDKRGDTPGMSQAPADPHSGSPTPAGPQSERGNLRGSQSVTSNEGSQSGSSNGFGKLTSLAAAGLVGFKYGRLSTPGSNGKSSSTPFGSGGGNGNNGKVGGAPPKPPSDDTSEEPVDIPEPLSPQTGGAPLPSPTTKPVIKPTSSSVYPSATPVRTGEKVKTNSEQYSNMMDNCFRGCGDCGSSDSAEGCCA